MELKCNNIKCRKQLFADGKACVTSCSRIHIFLLLFTYMCIISQTDHVIDFE